MHLTVSGIRDCFRFLGEMQPYRLLENSARWLDGTRTVTEPTVLWLSLLSSWVTRKSSRSVLALRL